MKKAVLFLAEGFEEVEAVGTVDYLRRSGIETVIASIKNEAVTSAHGVTILADTTVDKLDLSNYDAIILPGGKKGAENLRDDGRIIKAVKDFYALGKLVAAICAAPIVLDKAGVLAGKSFTVYKTFKNDIKNGTYKNMRSVTDGNIITGSGPGSVFEFCYAIVSYMEGEEIANKICLDMIIVS